MKNNACKNNYYVIMEREHLGVDQTPSSAEVYGIIKETPEDAVRYYTVDWSKIDHHIDFTPTREQISESDFENREVFGINKVLPLVHESKFSHFARHHQSEIFTFFAVMFAMGGIAICYWALPILLDNFKIGRLADIILILAIVGGSCLSGVYIADSLINRIIKKFGSTMWINRPPNTKSVDNL